MVLELALPFIERSSGCSADGVRPPQGSAEGGPPPRCSATGMVASNWWRLPPTPWLAGRSLGKRRAATGAVTAWCKGGGPMDRPALAAFTSRAKNKREEKKLRRILRRRAWLFCMKWSSPSVQPPSWPTCNSRQRYCWPICRPRPPRGWDGDGGARFNPQVTVPTMRTHAIWTHSGWGVRNCDHSQGAGGAAGGAFVMRSRLQSLVG